jgi:hypothetical protein
LTEVYLCHACCGQEIEGGNTPRGSLTKLTTLNLNFTAVHGDVSRLYTLSSLQVLGLRATSASGPIDSLPHGLAHNLSRLQKLDLGGTGVSGGECSVLTHSHQVLSRDELRRWGAGVDVHPQFRDKNSRDIGKSQPRSHVVRRRWCAGWAGAAAAASERGGHRRARQRRRAEGGRGEGEWGVASCMRPIVTEIYLCHACSCHEIEDGHAWTGKLPHQARHGLVQLHHLRGTLACVLRDSGALHRLAPTVRHMPGTGRRGHSLRRIYTYI